MTGRAEHDNKMLEYANRRFVNTDYLEEYAMSFGTKTAATKLRYLEIVNLFIEHFHINNVSEFQNIVPAKIYLFLNIFNSEARKHQVYYALANFFKFLRANRYVTENIMDDVEAPKVIFDQNIVAMDTDEISELKSRTKNGFAGETECEARRREGWRERDTAIIQLGITTGLRVSSLIEINLEDIDFEKRTVSTIEKGNKKRHVYLGDNVTVALKDWIRVRNEYLKKRGKECDALFISNQCKRISVRNTALIVEKYTKDFNKHITPHKMRSTCATNLYAATNDIYLVMDQLGHSNINNTRRYAKVSEDRRKEASDIMNKLI